MWGEAPPESREQSDTTWYHVRTRTRHTSALRQGWSLRGPPRWTLRAQRSLVLEEAGVWAWTTRR